MIALLALAAGCGQVPSLPSIDREPEKRCAGESCDSTPVQVDPAAPVTLWLVRFDGSMRLPADDGVDWYGVVLRGTLTVDGCGLIAGWEAFRVPQGGVVVRGKGDAVLGVAASQPLGKLGALGPAKASDAAGKCEQLDFEKQPVVTWSHGRSHARLGFRTGRAYFGLIYTDAGAGSPLHVHEGAWEVVELLRGAGEVNTDDDTAPMLPGTAYAFRPGQHHGFKSQNEPVVAVQMYSPPGPEQRFLDLAAGR